MRLLLFDIDHTLIDSGGAGRAAMELASRTLYGESDLMATIAVDGRTDRAIFEEVLLSHGLPETDLPRAFAAMLEAYLDALPRTLHERTGTVLAGVHDLLDALPADSAISGLGTGNVRAGAEIKLRYFGLWEHFAGGGFGDTATDRQHVILDGIAALATIAELAGKKPEPVVIGDTPLDIRAAHDAGARAVGVATGAFTVDALRHAGADVVLPDLSDTARALDALLN